MPENGVVTTKPANMTCEDAAGCPYGALMAMGLLTKIRLQSGEHVLVVGASGGIDTYTSSSTSWERAPSRSASR